MKIKDLIEAVKFQVSVKPQDDFMRELAEGLEQLCTENRHLKADVKRLQDLLTGWKTEAYKIANERDVETEPSNITEKYPHCVLCSNGAILTKSLEEYDKLIADISTEAVKEFAELLHCHCENRINNPINQKIQPLTWAAAYEEFEGVIDNLVKEMVGESNA